MKHWFLFICMMLSSSAYAWTASSYDKNIRDTVALMDLHYTAEIKNAYRFGAVEDQKNNARKIHGLWVSQRANVIREMTSIHKELVKHETSGLSSSVLIGAKLQQSLNALGHWKSTELSKVQTSNLSSQDKAATRLKVQTTYDRQAQTLRSSAAVQEKTVTALQTDAGRVLFSVNQDTSFALKIQR